MYRGGHPNNGRNDGLYYVNVNNGLTNARTNIGARLAANTSFLAQNPTPDKGEVSLPRKDKPELSLGVSR